MACVQFDALSQIGDAATLLAILKPSAQEEPLVHASSQLVTLFKGHPTIRHQVIWRAQLPWPIHGRSRRFHGQTSTLFFLMVGILNGRDQ